MAQRKHSPDTPQKGGDPMSSGRGNAKSSGKGGGRSAAASASAGKPASTTVRREKASPSGRQRDQFT